MNRAGEMKSDDVSTHLLVPDCSDASVGFSGLALTRLLYLSGTKISRIPHVPGCSDATKRVHTVCGQASESGITAIVWYSSIIRRRSKAASLSSSNRNATMLIIPLYIWRRLLVAVDPGADRTPPGSRKDIGVDKRA